jgi:DNA (cytosine-5)-methyltransferase 1
MAVDLFCGAGGLSLGLEEAGFAVVLGVDVDPISIETRQANFGGCSLCSDLSQPLEIRKIVTGLKSVHVSLLAAAPPCQPFSRAGRSKIRSLAPPVRRRHRERRELWRSVVDMVELVQPDAVLFENVPGMTEGEDISILARLVEGLEQAGYDVQLRRVAARAYGVPQHRERVFVVAVEPRKLFRWPEPAGEQVTLRDAIGDLPPAEGGVRRAWCEYPGPQTSLQQWFRGGVSEPDRHRIYDHSARAVREDDLKAFRLMDHGTKYSDLPEHLKRYRDDIFDDKYKRLPWDGMSRTITAHLAKDGYWYIHPEQHRTLTIREAAQIQTFPDRFRFTGTPTHQWRQIGNAVPPLLGMAIGRAILECLSPLRRREPEKGTSRVGRQTPASPPGRQKPAQPLSVVRDRLLEWWANADPKSLTRPWLKSGAVWQLLLGMILFERQPPRIVRDFWPTFARRWPTPKAFLADRRREAGLRILDRLATGQSLEQIARHLARSTADTLPPIEGVSAERVRLCIMLASAGVSYQPTAPAVRVAARLLGEEPTASRLEGQLLLVRVLGATQAAPAYAAILELAEQFCRPTAPACQACPLQIHCRTGRAGSTGS